MKYYIDFERLNKLTSHPADDENNKDNFYSKSYVYSLSRSMLKNYLRTFEDRNERRSNEENVEEAIRQLRFNKILLTENDIREKKLNHLLDEN